MNSEAGLDVAARHALVYIDPAAWTTALATRPELAGNALVAAWAAREWPLVLRRRCGGDGPDVVPLGLPLPPSHGKMRVAIGVPPAAVRSVRPPLALAAVQTIAPMVWNQTMTALLALADEWHVEARVFGSFAWAALTGLDYLTATSDLDLLWPLTANTRDLLPQLAALETDAPGRLDGEVVDADGRAVNWRELAGHTDDVLVKTIDGVALMGADAFLDSTRIAA